MTILLIQPAKAPVTFGGDDVFLYEPLALEYLAAGVGHDHDVKILDMRTGDDLETALAECRPDVVGITAYTVHVNVVHRLFARIKEWDPRILTVVGGHHATVVPEDFISPAIDLIVIGEGVDAFREIIRRFERGERFDSIPGVAVTEEDGLRITAPRTDISLDAFPFPDRGLTARYRKGYYSEWMKPLASIRTSKGCPFRCNFCALWKISGGRYMKRAPEKIVEELAGIEEENVFFADDESIVDADRMMTLARLIKEAGLRKRYFLYGRSDTISRNPELLARWREIGLERVFVGLEFCRDENLAYINKGSSSSDNAAAMRVLNDLGMDVYASFIVRPEFDRQDFTELGAYCRDLGVCFASFAVLTPLPGTDLYRDVRDRLITHDYEYYDFTHTVLPTRLPLPEFYERLTWLYNGAIPFRRRLSLLWKYPVRDFPKVITKTHRVFERMRTLYRDYQGDEHPSADDNQAQPPVR